jgi:hypothetical protein
MGYWPDGPDSIPGIAKFFSSAQKPNRFWDPPSLLSNDCLDSFPRMKLLGHEACHSPTSSAEVKNGGFIPPLPRVFL